jgi:uncharacterized repeat protein (TIGR01451 family)
MLRCVCTIVLTGAARLWAGDRPPRRARARAGAPGARGRFFLLAAMLVTAFGALVTSASANSPNPTSVVVNSETFSGSATTVTISGTWTWDERVPNGPQKDCNDSRIGVGYAIGWGDNTANPLKPKNSTEIIYVGDAEDDWVHSVTQGTQTVDGPFKPTPSKVTESMLGETLDAHNHGFGPQGISPGTPTARPTKAQAEHWVSNCGPTAQSVVNGQTVGNSKPTEPQNGFPNGTWGPISHTYATPGKHKICPVFYDPHGSHVGLAAGNEKEITAGGTNHNGDNSVESNNNPTPCVVAITLSPEPAFTIEKTQRIGPESSFTTSTLKGEVGQTVEYEITVKNTGNVPLTFGNFKDAGCENVAGGPSGPLAPEASATYTCEHLITIEDQKLGKHENNATDTGTPPEGEGSPITHTSNTVVVLVPEPAFTIEKLQKIEGSTGAFTTSPLIGKLGQVVDYEIIVKNTGNTSLTFSNFTDAKCEGIEGGPTTALAPTESATYTCKHTLTSIGNYVNEATDTGTPPAGEGPPITHTSNKVIVSVPEEPSFTIKKLQRIGSSSSYTESELTGKVGQTVEYEIVVKNTGNVALKFKALSDGKCEGISPAGEVEVAVGGEQTYTCSHKLTAVGKYTNAAAIEESKGHKEPSNEVVVNVPEEPSFTIKKLQRIGSSSSYTESELTGKVGQTVEYEIVVKNTGNVALKFKALSDGKCEGISPAGEVEVAVGGEQAYTCSHKLTAVGKYTNAAAIEESKGHKEPSNEVTVNVPPEAPHVYLGYADSAENNHGTNTSLPSPWKSSEGVVFEGCGFAGTDNCPKNSSGEDVYDAGAIRLEATTASGTQEVTAAKVVVGPCTYEPWPGLKATIVAGQNLILTQTGKHKCTENALESTNFDTSESFLASPQYKAFKEKGGSCANDGYIPTITLTINGQTVTLKDAGQILNWQGIDPDICAKATEFKNWVQIQ